MNKCIKFVIYTFVLILFISTVTTGCIKKEEPAPAPEPAVVNTKEAKRNKVNTDINADVSKMISYDIVDVGRSDPFVPYGEYKAFEDARNAAIREAQEHNAKVAEYKRSQNLKIREADDISPYSFNLPVPPTELASSDSAARFITLTKVVGIMYNSENPSAILNVNKKDYLVRPGDKIIDDKYHVIQINKNWVTVGFGSNIYSAGIGELFSKDELKNNRNDIYNLENRFGGRKS